MSAKQQILVVDDEPDARLSLGMLLNQMGHHAVLARDVDEALAALNKGHIGLVLCDLKLPGRSGFDLVREVRESPSLRGIPLIAR